LLEVILASWYLEAMRQLKLRGKPWPVRRLVYFLAGLAAVAAALESGVAVFVMEVFAVHIIQHLLLMIVAPVLLALSAPVTLLLQWADRPLRRRILGFLRGRFLHTITFPGITLFLYYGVMWIFFTTSLIRIAMDHMWLMDLFNISFFTGGVMFWWPIVGADSIYHWRLDYGGKLFSLALGIPLETFLGITLSMTNRPLDPAYSIHNWYVGGEVLWGLSELATGIAVGIVVSQWMRSEARASRRIDASTGSGAVGTRSKGVPREWYWAQQTIQHAPAGSPMYLQAAEVLQRLDVEATPVGSAATDGEAAHSGYDRPVVGDI
jgi:cytochrome c oxidase assembly factor CtaG